MTDKTRAELVQQIFAELTGDGSLEPAAEDIETIDGYIEGAIEQLSAKGVIEIGQTSHFEPATFYPLARWTANLAGPKFGAPQDTAVEAKAEADLRRCVAARPTYQTMRADYF